MQTARPQTARPPSGNGEHEASAELAPPSDANTQGSPVHLLQQHLVTRLSAAPMIASRRPPIDFRGGRLAVLAAALAGAILAGAQLAIQAMNSDVSRPSVQVAGVALLSGRAEATRADMHSPLPV